MDDFWEQLETIDRLPSREDRARLVRDAGDDPSMEKRVRIWDFFFRIQPSEVGKEEKAELEKARGELERLQLETRDLIESKEFEIEDLRRRLIHESRSLQGRIQNQQAQIQSHPDIEKVERRKQRAWIALAVAGALVLGSLSSCGSNEWGLGLLFGFFSVPALVVAVIAGLHYLSSRTLRQRIRHRLRAGMTELQERLRHRKSTLERQIEVCEEGIRRAREDLEYERTRLEEVCQELEQCIEELVAQIPVSPSAADVFGWLREDLAELGTLAVRETGLEGRLLSLRDAENPFEILGPAELQGQDRMPASYLRDPDRRRHLEARRFELLDDGSFVDFHGVYKLEFILIADDVLATFGVFYDFISGRRISEVARVQHYADVVSIHWEGGEREIQISGETRFIDNLPILSISLRNSETIQITFASESYFEALEVGYFDASRWKLNPARAAKQAVRNVQRRVDESKKKREVADLRTQIRSA